MDLCNNSLDLDFFFENGWLVNDNYFSAAFSRILLQEINFLRREGEFLKAGIGKGASFQHKPEIRSDFVYWLNPLSPSPIPRFSRSLFLIHRPYLYGQPVHTFNQDLFAGSYRCIAACGPDLTVHPDRSLRIKVLGHDPDLSHKPF